MRPLGRLPSASPRAAAARTTVRCHRPRGPNAPGTARAERTAGTARAERTVSAKTAPQSQSLHNSDSRRSPPAISFTDTSGDGDPLGIAELFASRAQAEALDMQHVVREAKAVQQPVSHRMGRTTAAVAKPQARGQTRGGWQQQLQQQQKGNMLLKEQRRRELYAWNEELRRRQETMESFDAV